MVGTDMQFHQFWCSIQEMTLSLQSSQDTKSYAMIYTHG